MGEKMSGRTVHITQKAGVDRPAVRFGHECRHRRCAHAHRLQGRQVAGAHANGPLKTVGEQHCDGGAAHRCGRGSQGRGVGRSRLTLRERFANASRNRRAGFGNADPFSFLVSISTDDPLNFTGFCHSRNGRPVLSFPDGRSIPDNRNFAQRPPPTTRSCGCASRPILSRRNKVSWGGFCSTTAPGPGRRPAYRQRLLSLRAPSHLRAAVGHPDQRHQAGRRDHRVRATAEPGQGGRTAAGSYISTRWRRAVPSAANIGATPKSCANAPCCAKLVAASDEIATNARSTRRDARSPKSSTRPRARSSASARRARALARASRAWTRCRANCSTASVPRAQASCAGPLLHRTKTSKEATAGDVECERGLAIDGRAAERSGPG